MDPNFVQHSLSDISVRFAGYLIFILAYSTAINGGVNGMFATFGVDVTQSKADDIVKGIAGMFLAVMIDLNMFFYVGGITNGQFTNSLAERALDGSPSGYFPPITVILFCNLFTGLLVVGGKKVITGVAEQFGSGVTAIKKAISNRNGNKDATQH